MLEEIVYRLHQLEVWWNLNRDWWWVYPYIHHYPGWSGLVSGLVLGYYAEPALDWVERMRCRRIMRRRLRSRSSSRK